MGTSSHIPWRRQTSWASNTLVEGLVGDRLSLGMIFTVAVMNLLHYALHFLGSEAPQELVGV